MAINIHKSQLFYIGKEIHVQLKVTCLKCRHGGADITMAQMILDTYPGTTYIHKTAITMAESISYRMS